VNTAGRNPGTRRSICCCNINRVGGCVNRVYRSVRRSGRSLAVLELPRHDQRLLCPSRAYLRRKVHMLSCLSILRGLRRRAATWQKHGSTGRFGLRYIRVHLPGCLPAPTAHARHHHATTMLHLCVIEQGTAQISVVLPLASHTVITTRCRGQIEQKLSPRIKYLILSPQQCIQRPYLQNPPYWVSSPTQALR
jgi:hypothetical protein